MVQTNTDRICGAMTIHVRPATEDDLPAILDIYNHAVLHTTASADYEPQTLAVRQQWFAERTGAGFPIFVAVNDSAVEGTDRVVGWSAYGPYHGRIGYRFTVENSIYVAADRQGQGVGKLLLATLIAHARERGFHSIIAGIDGSNEASMRLHAAFGFEHVGRLKEVVYKFDRWLDVVYMQLRLANTPAPQ